MIKGFAKVYIVAMLLLSFAVVGGDGNMAINALERGSVMTTNFFRGIDYDLDLQSFSILRLSGRERAKFKWSLFTNQKDHTLLL